MKRGSSSDWSKEVWCLLLIALTCGVIFISCQTKDVNSNFFNDLQKQFCYIKKKDWPAFINERKYIFERPLYVNTWTVATS
jgi:hypothetical protein